MDEEYRNNIIKKYVRKRKGHNSYFILKEEKREILKKAKEEKNPEFVELLVLYFL